MERREADLIGSERTMLCGFLDYQRATFVGKVSGLTRQQLAQPMPSSSLTLAGLTKHLALVEDSWFQEKFLGRSDVEPWSSAPFDDDPDWEFHTAADHDAEELRGMYSAACARSRLAERSAGSLDDVSASTDTRTGSKFSLRWILLHMLEETARHNGHADLLREAIDGTTGE